VTEGWWNASSGGRAVRST